MRRVTLWIVLLTAGCGGGSGDAPAPRSAPGNVPPVVTAFVLDGPAVAEAGRPYAARIESPYGTSFSVAAAPDGMTIDTATGEVRWTPSESAAGAHEILLDTPDGARDTLELRVQGRRRVALQAIGAQAGGVIDIVVANSPATGSRVVIPPGAMAQDATITVDLLAERDDLPPGFFAFDLGPSQTFGADVTLEVAYDAAFLNAAGVADETALTILHLDEATGSWNVVPSTVDTARRRITAAVSHFSVFAVFVDRLEALADDALEALRTWVERAGPQAAVSAAVEIVESLLRAYQDHDLRFRWGDRCTMASRNALVIHGIFSDASMQEEIVLRLVSRYDTVLVYEYPSALSIGRNALVLARKLAAHPAIEPGSSLDVYGHSMGGLIARSAVEKHGSVLTGAGLRARNIVALGTPHLGSPLADLFPILTSIRQMRSSALFLATLNLKDPIEDWVSYTLIAGEVSFPVLPDDLVVDKESARAEGVLDATCRETVELNHFELSDEYGRVASLVNACVRTGRIVPVGITVPGRSAVNGPEVPGDPATLQYVEGTATVSIDSVNFSVPPGTCVRMAWISSVDGDLFAGSDSGVLVQCFELEPGLGQPPPGVVENVGPPQGLYEFHGRIEDYPAARRIGPAGWTLHVEITIPGRFDPIILANGQLVPP